MGEGCRGVRGAPPQGTTLVPEGCARRPTNPCPPASSFWFSRVFWVVKSELKEFQFGASHCDGSSTARMRPFLSESARIVVQRNFPRARSAVASTSTLRLPHFEPSHRRTSRKKSRYDSLSNTPSILGPFWSDARDILATTIASFGVQSPERRFTPSVWSLNPELLLRQPGSHSVGLRV